MQSYRNAKYEFW